MKFHHLFWTAGISLGAAGLVVGVAGANEPPAWEPADPDLSGAISLYDASGTEVTTGSTDAPLAAFAVGGTEVAANDTAAALYAYTPVAGAAPGSWTGLQLTATSTYPVNGAPAGLPSGPTAVITSASTTLAQYAAANPSATGVYELRLRTTAPGHAASEYQAVAVEIDGDTWTVSDGIGTEVTDTTTTLATSPAAPRAGDSVTLTATVSPATATGTVQFRDGSSLLGSAVTLNGGTATLTTKLSTAGSHAFTATLVPGTGFGASVGSASVSVAKANAAIRTTLKPTRITPSTKARLTVAVSAAGLTPTGKVTVKDGSKVVATGTLKAGKVTVTLPRLKKGRHTVRISYPGTANIAAASKTLKLTSK